MPAVSNQFDSSEDNSDSGIRPMINFVTKSNANKSRRLSIWVGNSGWWLEVYGTKQNEWISEKLQAKIKQLPRDVKFDPEDRNFRIGNVDEDETLIAKRIIEMVPLLDFNVDE